MKKLKQTVIFDLEHRFLGEIPGPLRVETIDDTIWAAGGHKSGAVFRYADGSWSVTRLDFTVNFVIALDRDSAVVGGIAGKVARTFDGGATWKSESLGDPDAWLVAGSRDRAGRIWIGQQMGSVWRAPDARGKFEKVAQVTGTVNAVRQLDDEYMMVVTEKFVRRVALRAGTVKREPLFEVSDANLIDGVVATDGRIVVVADKGRGWISTGKRFAKIELGAGKVDMDAVFFLDGQFTALGEDGILHVSEDGRAWTRRMISRKGVDQRLGGVASWQGGWLVGSMRADVNISGKLVYLGDPAAAPIAPAAPPEKIADLDFVLAERFALAWATTWAALPNAEATAAAWMAVASKLR